MRNLFKCLMIVLFFHLKTMAVTAPPILGIGSTSGYADFGQGSTTSQTLRVTIAEPTSGITVTLDASSTAYISQTATSTASSSAFLSAIYDNLITDTNPSLHQIITNTFNTAQSTASGAATELSNNNYLSAIESHTSLILNNTSTYLPNLTNLGMINTSTASAAAYLNDIDSKVSTSSNQTLQLTQATLTASNTLGIYNRLASPLSVTVTNPTSSIVSVSGPVTVSGIVQANILSLPVVSATILNPVTSVSATVTNFPLLQQVSGSVAVSNLPAVQTVSTTGTIPVFVTNQTNSIVTVSGPVAISNFPTIQVVQTSGTTTVSGVVSSNVLNFPALQQVSGSVNVGNFPLVQAVSSTGISSVSVVNLPATQVVSGIVQVGNVVSATVLNFPSVQPTSATGITQVSGTVFVQNVVSVSTTGVTQVSGTIQNIPDLLGAAQNITIQDTASTSALQYASQTTITGTPTAGSAAGSVLTSINTVMVEISGTWTGALATEVSSDGGTSWETRSIHVVGTSIFSGSITGNVTGSMNASAKTNVRVRATSAITGTAVVKFLFSDNLSNVYVANSIKLIDSASTLNPVGLNIVPGNTLPAVSNTAVVTTVRDTVSIQGLSNTPGTTSGGILTIQGDPNGSRVPVSTKTNIVSGTIFSVSIGTGPTQLLAQNTLRKGLTFTDIGNSQVFCNTSGSNAVSGSGIALWPGGSFYMDEYSFTTSSISCAASGTASILSGEEKQ